MPHQDGVLADRLGQLGVLHVHLFSPVGTVGVRVEGELALIGEILHRRILQLHLFAAHMEAAAVLDLDNIIHGNTSLSQDQDADDTGSHDGQSDAHQHDDALGQCPLLAIIGKDVGTQHDGGLAGAGGQ